MSNTVLKEHIFTYILQQQYSHFVINVSKLFRSEIVFYLCKSSSHVEAIIKETSQPHVVDTYMPGLYLVAMEEVAH